MEKEAEKEVEKAMSTCGMSEDGTAVCRLMIHVRDAELLNNQYKG